MSTKQLCRNLKDNPNVAENMAKVASERQTLQVLLASCLMQLERDRTIIPIVESVLASEKAEVEMRETVENERSTTAAVRQLKGELKDEKAAHEEAVREKKKLLLALKETLAETKLKTAVDTRVSGKDMTADNESAKRLQQVELEDLRKQLALTKQQLQLEQMVAATSAQFLEAVSLSLSDKAAGWAKRREEHAREKERDLERLRARHAKDARALADMREVYDEEVGLQKERQAQLAEEAEQAAAAAALEQRQLRAVVTIQAFYRGWKARTGGKNKNKGKGKAKGKGKKKK